MTWPTPEKPPKPQITQENVDLLYNRSFLYLLLGLAVLFFFPILGTFVLVYAFFLSRAAKFGEKQLKRQS